MRDKRTYGAIIGTLAAAKLMLLLENKGEAEWQGDPSVWERLEQISDDLAEKRFEAVTSGREWAEMLPHPRPVAEREYLHLVRSRKGYYWCKTNIADDEEIPERLAERVQGTARFARDICYRIIKTLGDRRVATGAQRDLETSRNEHISQVVAVMALSKLILAFWGNGKEAALFERLAEKVSEAEYKSTCARAED
jgi:hypothetical protein